MTLKELIVVLLLKHNLERMERLFQVCAVVIYTDIF